MELPASYISPDQEDSSYRPIGSRPSTLFAFANPRENLEEGLSETRLMFDSTKPDIVSGADQCTNCASTLLILNRIRSPVGNVTLVGRGDRNEAQVKPISGDTAERGSPHRLRFTPASGNE